MADRKFTSDEVTVTVITFFVLLEFRASIGPIVGHGFYLIFFPVPIMTLGLIVGNWISRRAELLEWFKATLRSVK